MTTMSMMIDRAAATRPRRFARRAALVTVGIAALLATGFLGWGTVARFSLANAHPPPGQLVDVGGHRLHIACVGEGSGPTVILEAGNADFSVMWAKMQPELATSARVCAYDRAGLGWSERGTAPRTLDAMTSELARLLDGAGIEVEAAARRAFVRRHRRTQLCGGVSRARRRPGASRSGP